MATASGRGERSTPATDQPGTAREVEGKGQGKGEEKVKEKGKIGSQGIEVRLADEPGFRGRDDLDRCGALSGLLAPLVPAYAGATRWNQMRFRCDGDRMVVTLNGKTIIDTDSQGKITGLPSARCDRPAQPGDGGGVSQHPHPRASLSRFLHPTFKRPGSCSFQSPSEQSTQKTNPIPTLPRNTLRFPSLISMRLSAPSL